MSPEIDDVRGKSHDLLPLASKVRNVTLLLLPVEVRDQAVAQVLGAYGKIIRMTRETHCGYAALEIGTRRVTVEMERELPNYISVFGFRGPLAVPDAGTTDMLVQSAGHRARSAAVTTHHETQREGGGHKGDNPLFEEDEEADMPAAALRPSENSETQRGGASSVISPDNAGASTGDSAESTPILAGMA
ncbi:hypothetical protein ISCGN_029738 [Ixodes scapularis]